MLNIYILGVGIFSGVIGTLLGLGGGTFTLPILVVILKMDIHLAISLSLVSIIAKSLLSTAINIKNNYINIPLGLILTPSALIGSTIGGRIGFTSTATFLSLLFSGVLLTGAILVYVYRKSYTKIFIPQHIFNGSYSDSGKILHYTPKHYYWGMIISTIGGFLGGALGIGGGGILVPIMKLINGLPMKAATTTSLFIMGIASIIPTMLYYNKGVLQPEYAVFILVGSCIGAILGSKIVRVTHDKHIAKIFSLVLIIIAMTMIYDTIIL